MTTRYYPYYLFCCPALHTNAEDFKNYVFTSDDFLKDYSSDVGTPVTEEEKENFLITLEHVDDPWEEPRRINNFYDYLRYKYDIEEDE